MADQIDRSKLYPIEEAVSLVKKASTSKFVGSVDIDILLNLAGSKKQESIFGSVVLPNKFGADTKVAVIADGEAQTRAKEAGADKVGYKELIKEISDGVIDFDVLIATPDVMRDLAKLGRVLGPKNLMPSPKNETVTNDVEKAIETYKAGKLNFKMSDQKTIRNKVGDVSMDEKALQDNVVSFVKEVYESAKKLGIQPFKKITLSPTMGKGIKVEISSIID